MALSRVAAAAPWRNSKEYQALSQHTPEVRHAGVAWPESPEDADDDEDIANSENETAEDAENREIDARSSGEDQGPNGLSPARLPPKKLTSQQRARRLLSGKNPWRRRSRCPCADVDASKRRRHRRRFKAMLARGIHVALSAFVLTVFSGHRNSIMREALTDTFVGREDGAAVSFQDVACGLGYLFLYAVALVLYFVTCCRDPGFVPPNDPKEDGQQNRDDVESRGGRFWNDFTKVDGVVDPATRYRMPHDPSKPLLRECGFCGIPQPLRTRHCEDCGFCVRRYDHHCPWLETCVGQRNHAAFWWFLFFEGIVLSASLYINSKSIMRLDMSMPGMERVLDNLGYIINFVILVPSIGMVIGLLAFHTYLASVNATTWEMTSRHRITYLAELEDDLEPFDAGLCYNLLQFCCVMGSGPSRLALRWETQYLSRVAQHERDQTLEMDPL